MGSVPKDTRRPPFPDPMDREVGLSVAFEIVIPDGYAPGDGVLENSRGKGAIAVGDLLGVATLTEMSFIRRLWTDIVDSIRSYRKGISLGRSFGHPDRTTGDPRNHHDCGASWECRAVGASPEASIREHDQIAQDSA